MNIRIRPWRIEDAPELVKVMNNKNIQNNLRDGLPYPYTLSDAEMFIAAMLGAEKDTQYTWTITADEKTVGSIGIFRKDNIHSRTAEMGYCISESWWGKGIGTLAVKEACESVFLNTDILRVFAEPFAYNTASCRVLEKAGFQFEGTLRKNAVKNGEVLDMKMYALVKEFA